MRQFRGVLVALFLFLSLAEASDIGLSPPRLELAGQPGQTLTETVTLFTTATTQQQITTEMNDWTLTPDGSLTFLSVGAAENSASDWFQVDSEDFFIAPEGSQEVRFSVTIPDDASLEGTYQGVVFFRVVPPDSASSGVGVVTTTRIGLIVYVTVTGTEQGGSELLDVFQDNDESITIAVANLGNTLMRVGGTVELRGEDGETKHRLEVPDIAVLRDSERDIVLPFKDVEPGFYVALALLEDSRGGLLVGELPIEVP